MLDSVFIPITLLTLYAVFVSWEVSRRVYFACRYKKAPAEFVQWVKLNPRDTRSYPEYGFVTTDGARRVLVNRDHMDGDDPHPMSILYHPLKPQKALFYTVKYFLVQPISLLIVFALNSYLLLRLMLRD